MSRQMALVTIFLLFMFALVYSLQKDPHAFKQAECIYCHASGVSGKTMIKMSGGATSMACKKCHSNIFTEGYMHPFNVRPQKVSVPQDMPLSSDGELTCTTCHNIHASYLTPSGAPSHYLRRNEPGSKFCEACHKRGLSGSPHSAALGEAHFTSRYIVTDSSQNIDQMSKNCITCHDGAISASVLAAGTWQHEKSFMKFDKGEHPIGVDYEQARLRRGRRSDLKPMGAVDRRLRFFNGKIGCGTCHDPYSTIERQLVMSDEHSRLCFACHAM